MRTILLWSALTCQRFPRLRPVADFVKSPPSRMARLQQNKRNPAPGRRRPKRGQVGALQKGSNAAHPQGPTTHKGDLRDQDRFDAQAERLLKSQDNLIGLMKMQAEPPKV
jgi:hypothetical protein